MKHRLSGGKRFLPCFLYFSGIFFLSFFGFLLAFGFFLIFPALIGFFFAHRGIINLFGQKVGNVLIKLSGLNTVVKIK